MDESSLAAGQHRRADWRHRDAAGRWRAPLVDGRCTRHHVPTAPRKQGAAALPSTMQCPVCAGPMYFLFQRASGVAVQRLRWQRMSSPRGDTTAMATATAAATAAAAARWPPDDPMFADPARCALLGGRPGQWPLCAAGGTGLSAFLHPDRLLFFFRRLANVPQPRPDLTPYGGWESQGSGLRGEFAGHYLHAAAAAAVATSDALLRSRCEYVVRVLAECQEAMGDGYLSAFPQSEFATVEDFKSRSPWVPYYVMHKLLAGLITTYELLGDATAIRVAERLAGHLRARAPPDGARPRRVVRLYQPGGGRHERGARRPRARHAERHVAAARGMFERPCFIGALGAAARRRRSSGCTRTHTCRSCWARWRGTSSARGAARRRGELLGGALRAAHLRHGRLDDGRGVAARGRARRRGGAHGADQLLGARPGGDVRRAQLDAHLAPAAHVERCRRVGAAAAARGLPGADVLQRRPRHPARRQSGRDALHVPDGVGRVEGRHPRRAAGASLVERREPLLVLPGERHREPRAPRRLDLLDGGRGGGGGGRGAGGSGGGGTAAARPPLCDAIDAEPAAVEARGDHGERPRRLPRRRRRVAAAPHARRLPAPIHRPRRRGGRVRAPAGVGQRSARQHERRPLPRRRRRHGGRAGVGRGGHLHATPPRRRLRRRAGRDPHPFDLIRAHQGQRPQFATLPRGPLRPPRPVRPHMGARLALRRGARSRAAGGADQPRAPAGASCRARARATAHPAARPTARRSDAW